MVNKYPGADEYHQTRKKSSRRNTCEYVVIHYTAGSGFDSAVKTLSVGIRKVSVQFVIGRDGQVAQIGDPADVLWHAGRSSWDGKTGLNSYSIGIELVNPGYMSKVSDGVYATYYGQKYNKEDLVIARHPDTGSDPMGWLPYSEKQLDALKDLVAWLYDEYPIKEVVGHEQISPGRKQDPAIGIIFPKKLLKELNNDSGAVRSTDDDDTTVTKTTQITGKRVKTVTAKPYLNVRAAPSAKARKVAQLKFGEKIEIISIDKYGWAKISEDQYCSSLYLK